MIRGLKTALIESLVRVQFGPRPAPVSYRSSVAFDAAGNDVVRDLLCTQTPLLVGRLGLSELNAMSFRARWRSRGMRVGYPRLVRSALRVNAGFFPAHDEAIDDFCDEMMAALGDVDVLAVWLNRSEHLIAATACPAACLIELASLNSMCWRRPWTAGLEGRRVLVVHPFATTIACQYQDRRSLLFADPEVLPEFELVTYRPVQSIAGETGGFASWFDALETMKYEIAGIPFDTAIIGAGAYGLPLAASIKRSGRQAIHMGGSTQLLFGIKGRRWEEEYADTVAPLFNEYWVRPAPEERPARAEAVESACYW